MLTRCPRCSTTFRVTPEQLKARHGRVRCGHCQDVFNALDTLIEAAPPAAATPTAGAQVEEAGIEDTAAPPARGDAVEEPAAAPLTEDAAEEASPEASDAAAGEGAEPAAAALADEQEAAAAPPPSAVPEPEPLLHEAPKKRGWPWALGSAAAIVVLMMQAALHYRTEVAVLYPSAKPLLSALCAPFACEVSLPRKAELVGIETSSLAPESAGKLALSATLKNRAPFAQQYPDLELTLTDTADKALVRRVLPPADYLPPKTDVAGGFPAGAEIAVNLVIDAPGLPAAGYQLYLFYP